jgi:1,4-alpha-glucan branching enzyme
VLIFERGGVVFAFNFNPERSFANVSFSAAPGAYRIELSSDDAEVGGFGRIDTSLDYVTAGSNNQLSLYLPARTAVALTRRAK